MYVYTYTETQFIAFSSNKKKYGAAHFQHPMGYSIFLFFFCHSCIFVESVGQPNLLDLVQFLHNQGCRRAASVAYGCDTVLARLKLVKQSRENARSGAAERVTERDGATERVDTGVLQSEDLHRVSSCILRFHLSVFRFGVQSKT